VTNLSIAANPKTLLQAHGVSLAYGDGDQITYALSDVSLSIPPRGFIGVMGPSGSGKSSLLYLLSGLKAPTSGEVEIEGRSMCKMGEREITRLRRNRFGFVFQSPFLLNYLTARENVLAAAPQGDSDSQDRTEGIFESLDIAKLADKFPHHLSGGERQRVCVARAMINRPDVIFADEPTASLDHANGHAVIDLLASYRDNGVVIVVTHDPEMVTDAEHVFKMRDGRLEE